MHATATATAGDAAPFQGYEGLKGRELLAQIRLRSQVELTRIDSYERSHQARPSVLDKLRYLRCDEPLAGYDQLDSDAIVTALSAADSAKLSRVRSYETKLRARPEVLTGVAEIRAASLAARGPAPAGGGPEDAAPWEAPHGPLQSIATLGISGLVAFSAVLMVVLILVVGFMVLAAVAPDLLIR
jgi:hypothetical protein